MSNTVLLVAQVLAEFLLYDMARKWFKVGPFYKRLGTVASVAPREERRQEIGSAIRHAVSLYPKHVRCLQQSTAAARILRRNGFAAELVIGCRPEPFMGHAWVEIENQPFSGPKSFGRRLLILDRVR